MIIEQDFTTRKFTLVFESSDRRISLTHSESEEFESKIRSYVVYAVQTDVDK